MIILGLWNNRNDILWENKSQRALDIVMGAFTWLSNYHKAQCLSTVRITKLKKLWKLDEVSKLNIDGAFMSNTMTRVLVVFYGVLKLSLWQRLHNQYRYHVSLALNAELCALWTTLHFLEKRGIVTAEIEMDCLVAIQTIHNPVEDLSELSNLVRTLKPS